MGEAQDSPHVGQAPGVDGLVVVTDHEQVVLRRRQQPHQAQLGGIHILELVDANVAEACLPAQAEPGIGTQEIGRAHHEVVEIDRASGTQQIGIGVQGRPIGVRRHDTLDLPPRQPGIELGWLGDSDVRGVSLGAPARRTDEGEAVRDDARALACVAQDESRQGMEGPNLDRRGRRHVAAQAPFDAAGEVMGGVAIERHHADAVGGHAPGEQDGDPGDHGGGLATPRRRDDLRRTVRQRCGLALLIVECAEDGVECGRRGRRSFHPTHCSRIGLPWAHRPLTEVSEPPHRHRCGRGRILSAAPAFRRLNEDRAPSMNPA